MMSKSPFLLKLLGFVALFFLLDFVISSFLLSGLNKYYGLEENSEIAMVGHSHLMLGVDKEKIEKEFSFGVSKYTREGVNVLDRKIMIEQLVNSNKQLKTLIYGVDAWTFTSEGLSSNSYKLFYPFIEDSTIGDYIYNNSTYSEYLTKKIFRTSRFDELLLNSSLRGHLGKWTNLKYGSVDISKLKVNIQNQSYRKIDNSEENVTALKETMTILAENDIQVILLYVPTIDLLSEVQIPEYENTLGIIKNIAKEFNNVDFVSFQEPWSHDYNLFFDPIHLNPEGQSIITQELIDYLKTDTK